MENKNNNKKKNNIKTNNTRKNNNTRTNNTNNSKIIKKQKNNIELYTTNKDEFNSLGIIRGMAMTRMSSIKSFLSGISSIITDSDEKFSGVHDLILETQNRAIEELKKEAKKLKASKIIGIQIDNSEISLGDRSGIFVVYVYGTAIK